MSNLLKCLANLNDVKKHMNLRSVTSLEELKMGIAVVVKKLLEESSCENLFN